MRFYILRALLAKEIRRHVANRGGLALAGLLIVAALLLTIFKPSDGSGGVAGGELVGGVHRCYIEYLAEDDFIRRMQNRVPEDMKAHVVFRTQPPELIKYAINYEPGSGAIRAIATTDDGSPRGVPEYRFEVWHPPENPTALSAYEQWFFRAARDVFREQAAEKLGAKLREPTDRKGDLWAEEDAFRALDAEVERLRPSSGSDRVIPKVVIERKNLGAKPLDMSAAVATAMVVFALYFTCCYLLPTLNCEERERGVLLAQALSPASPIEIVAAKFLFYPVAGIGLAAALAGIYNPAVLGTLFFWLSLLAMACGFLGIGMTVSTLAKTQRGAFMGSMSYLLCVALLLFVCSQANVPFVANLAIESHGPKILHAAMTREVKPESWIHLLAALGLAAVWMTLAGWLFRKRGWQ